MKQLASFGYSILGGLCIGIGGAIFLSLENKVLGAVFFTVGLFTIVTNRLNLFTGKVLYLFDNKPGYLLTLGQIWLGNLMGTALVAYSLRATRLAGAITAKADALCQTKLNDSLASIFILSIFCNILMFVAVDGFKYNTHPLGKYLGLFLGVPVFILCGFEHSVANMFYFSAAGAWSAKTVLYLLVMTLGNAAGGVLFPLARKFSARAQAAQSGAKAESHA
jgi:formate/nitrite transporter FocA (FNT family)